MRVSRRDFVVFFYYTESQKKIIAEYIIMHEDDTHKSIPVTHSAASGPCTCAGVLHIPYPH